MIDPEDRTQLTEHAEPATTHQSPPFGDADDALTTAPVAVPSELIADVLKRAHALLSVDFVALYQGGQDGLELQAVESRLPNLYNASDLHLGTGFLGKVASNGQSYQVCLSATNSDSDAIALSANGLRSVAAAPVQVLSRRCGVVLVGTVAEREFSPTEVHLLEQFGIQAALALEQSRLRQETRREIADRAEAESSRRRSEQRFRTLFDYSPEAVFLLDAHDPVVPMRIVDCNNAAARQYGFRREDLIGQPLLRLSAASSGSDDASELGLALDRMRREGVVRSAVRHRRKSGEIIYIERAAALVQLGPDELVLGIDHDVTERRRLEEQLRHAQKMEAIGRLTGGVAHDFNNMLSVIGGYAELLLLDCPPGSPGRERVEEIQKAAQRAADLTRQLLLFSRKEVPRLGPVDLNEAVQDLTKMLGRLIGENIHLSTRFDPDLGKVRADTGQLQQILVNLAVNARDAMPGGGRLSIETRRIQADAATAALSPEMPAGVYARLVVSDTGTGMDEATRERVFEPFFTTKPPGKGTGLGLAVVYEIVRQCGGFIHVYSEPGEGTVFRVYFPVLPEAEGSLIPGEDGDQRYRGTETILLAEDEEMLRGMLRLTLAHLGYQVLAAETPEAALQLLSQHPAPIHLLLSDLVMPGISGRKLAEQGRQLRPGMRVILMSGYTDEMVLRSGSTDEGYAFIEKPFPMSELAKIVRETLQRDAPPRRLPHGSGRVLVVDDDPNARETLVELLSDEGYHVETASDGCQALERLRAGSLPHVILLDLRMPSMNGWVFRIEQRKDPVLAQIPVVVLSGAQDPAAAADFLETDDFLPKPIDVDVLLRLVRKHCGSDQRS